jgi:hypothetical protein
MTLTTFNKLYKHYKDTFDLEMSLSASHTTYAKLKAKQELSDQYF